MRRFVGAVTGVGVPASLFFSSYPPPLFPGIGLITAALSALIWAIVSFRSKNLDQATITVSKARRAKRSILLAVILIVFYILLLQFTTLRIPSEPKKRVQIGFDTLDCSLTDQGRAWKQSQPGITAFEIARNEAAFVQEQVPKAWQPWSVYAAGVALIALYLAGFSLWAKGFALVGIREKPPAQHIDT